MTFITLFVYCVSFVFGWNFLMNVMVSPWPTTLVDKIKSVTTWLKLWIVVLVRENKGYNEQFVLYLCHSSS